MGMPRERLQVEVDDFQRFGATDLIDAVAVCVRPSYVPVFRCAPHRTSYGHAGAGGGAGSWVRPRRSAPRALDVVLPPVVLHAHFRSVGQVVSAPDVGGWWKVNVNCASGGPAQRTSGGVGPAGVGAGWGFNRGGCRRLGRSPRLAPEATRNLPGVQQATVFVDAEFDIRLLHPRQNPGRATPARRGERPNLRGNYLRYARAQSRHAISDVKFRIHGGDLGGVRGEI